MQRKESMWLVKDLLGPADRAEATVVPLSWFWHRSSRVSGDGMAFRLCQVMNDARTGD
jgi:hypothetical protein